MTVDRRWAEWKIAQCQGSIEDNTERYRAGFISKEIRDQEIKRLTDAMYFPKLLLDIENGVPIA